MSKQAPIEDEPILYRTANDAIRIEVFFETETFWRDQRRIAELFGVDVLTLSEHPNNFFACGELAEEATFRTIRMVRTEGEEPSCFT
jgi:hypothetical protein